jgi:hypothetical protein
VPEGTDAVTKPEENTTEEPVLTVDGKSWPSEREWPPNDERWGGQPQQLDEEREPSIFYDRAKCPLIPLKDYVILRGDQLEFTSLHGIFVPKGPEMDGADLATPILTVVRCGPDVTKYKPGDYVITNPRNQELAWAWADPRPPHTTYTFLLMREGVIICNIDYEVIQQLRKRGKYLRAEQKKREAAAAKERKFQESDLNPNKGKEVLDALGEPISKKGEQEVPEVLTEDTPPH